MERTLDFEKQKVEVMSLDELKLTQRENFPDGRPVNGVYHWELIEQVADIFGKAGLDVQPAEIFAAQNQDKYRPGVTKINELMAQYGENALEAHILRRVYTTLEVKNGETDEHVMNICIAYHQKGIQIAYGPMAKICHNQMILGAQACVANYSCYGRSYKDSKMTLPEMMDWCYRIAGAFGGIIDKNIHEVEEMKTKMINHQQALYIFGLMEYQRVLAEGAAIQKDDRNYGYSLNGTQINRAIENYYEAINKQEQLSLYDFYQCCNVVLKAAKADIPTLLPQGLKLYETVKTVHSS